MKPIDREQQKLVKRAMEHREFAIPELPFYEQWSLQYLDDDDSNDMCGLFMEMEIPTIWLHPDDLDKPRDEMFAFYDEMLSEFLIQCKGWPEDEVPGLLDEVRLKPEHDTRT